MPFERCHPADFLSLSLRPLPSYRPLAARLLAAAVI
jgi:hypothetical protein